MRSIFTLLTFFAFSLAYSQDYPISVDASGKFAVLTMPDSVYHKWNNSTDEYFSNYTKRTELFNMVYNKFEDDYDFIFVLMNNSSVPSGLPTGELIQVKNEVEGIGLNTFDYTSNYGSSGKLQAVMTLYKKNYILYGPSLHEIAHNWANFAFDTYALDPFGEGCCGGVEQSYYAHWGVSSTGGQLGGFDSLVTNIDNNPNKYQGFMDGDPGFGQFANGGNGVPFSNIELYLMGMIPASEIEPFDLFSGLTSVKNDGTFEATTRISFDSDSVVSYLGARNPSATLSQKDFKLLVLFTTGDSTDVLTSDLEDIRTHIDKFTLQGDDGLSAYNFYEATGGKGTISTGDLNQSLLPTTGLVIENIQISNQVTPNPNNGSFQISCSLESKITITNQIGQTVNYQVIKREKDKTSFLLLNKKPGLYIVQILNSSGIETLHFIVK